MSLITRNRNSKTNYTPSILDRDLALANRICLRLEKVMNLTQTSLGGSSINNYYLSSLSILDSISLGKQNR